MIMGFDLLEIKEKSISTDVMAACISHTRYSRINLPAYMSIFHKMQGHKILYAN